MAAMFWFRLLGPDDRRGAIEYALRPNGTMNVSRLKRVAEGLAMARARNVKTG